MKLALFPKVLNILYSFINIRTSLENYGMHTCSCKDKRRKHTCGTEAHHNRPVVFFLKEFTSGNSAYHIIELWFSIRNRSFNAYVSVPKLFHQLFFFIFTKGSSYHNCIAEEDIRLFSGIDGAFYYFKCLYILWFYLQHFGTKKL